MVGPPFFPLAQSRLHDHIFAGPLNNLFSIICEDRTSQSEGKRPWSWLSVEGAWSYLVIVRHAIETAFLRLLYKSRRQCAERERRGKGGSTGDRCSQGPPRCRAGWRHTEQVGPRKESVPAPSSSFLPGWRFTLEQVAGTFESSISPSPVSFST